MKMNVDKYVKRVNARLSELMADCSPDPTLADAMAYSLDAGGKRLRPTLSLMTCDLLGGSEEECLDYACAIEMIHTYSLIHDDLPAMDNDELRRGRPTSHVKFGEAMAILAGDGLLTYAFYVLSQNGLRNPENLAFHMQALDLVAMCAGPKGMVAGQAMDMTWQDLDEEPTESQIRGMYERKTGALILASIVGVAMLCHADQADMDALMTYATSLGVAFQVEDDILDVTSTAEILGKTPGKDAAEEKATLVALCGVDKCRQIVRDATDRAVSALAPFGEKARPLVDLALSMVDRDR